MSDTPETDAKVSGHIGFYSCATVPAELCRRMERERNEAIAARKASSAEWMEQISNAEKRVKEAQEIAARALIQRDEILKALEK